MIDQAQAQASFTVGEHVVYPTHGVGTITAEEKQVVAGTEMQVYVVSFIQDKMIIRVPKTRALKAGLRRIGCADDTEMAIKILGSRPRINKGMWGKRAKEYEAKINSGSLKLLAEVLRDLHKNDGANERSYSEKQLYDAALSRFLEEYCMITELTREHAIMRITSVLNYRVMA